MGDVLKGVLIDDSKSWVRGMPMWISRFDIELEAFLDLEDASQFLKRAHVDFVLLDYILETEFDTAADVLQSKYGPGILERSTFIFSRKPHSYIIQHGGDIVARLGYISKREPIENVASLVRHHCNMGIGMR
jgi:hypothetical protein